MPATKATLEGGAAEQAGGAPLAEFVDGKGWFPAERYRGGVGRSSGPRGRLAADVGGRRGGRGGRRRLEGGVTGGIGRSRIGIGRRRVVG
jgi:hypothetical protein